MLYVVLIALVIICAIGWWSRYISTAVLICFMDKKGYQFPSKDEMKECSDFVVRHMFSDLLKKIR